MTGFVGGSLAGDAFGNAIWFWAAMLLICVFVTIGIEFFKFLVTDLSEFTAGLRVFTMASLGLVVPGISLSDWFSAATGCLVMVLIWAWHWAWRAGLEQAKPKVKRLPCGCQEGEGCYR